MNEHTILGYPAIMMQNIALVCAVEKSEEKVLESLQKELIYSFNAGCLLKQSEVKDLLQR